MNRKQKNSSSRLLFAGLFVVAALGLLLYRVSQTVSRVQRAPLRLGEAVELGTPPAPLGDDRIAGKERLEALNAQRETAQSTPQTPQDLARFARDAAIAGDALTSWDALRVVIKSTPNADPVLWEALGRSEIQLSRFSDALNTFRKLIQLNPNKAAYHIGLGRAYRYLNRRAEAVETIEKATRLIPESDVPNRLALVQEFEEMGDINRALQAAQALQATNPTDLALQKKVGTILFRMGRVPEAYALFEAFFAQHPDDKDAKYFLAVLTADPLCPKRDLVKAESLFLEILQSDAKDARTATQLGRLYMDQSRWKQAAYIYITLLTAHPDTSSARLQLARAYDQIGDKKAAETQRAFGNRLAESEREESRLIAQKTNFPLDPQKRIALVNHYLSQGRYAKAMPEIQAAYSLAPKDPTVQSAWKSYYAKLGVAPPPITP